MPILMVFAMVVVGMGLTIADFRRVAIQPRAVPPAILGQTVSLPGLGWILASGLQRLTQA
ncbi:hypothetical protein ACYOEI_00930 [Singulisphaera rosea]